MRTTLIAAVLLLALAAQGRVVSSVEPVQVQVRRARDVGELVIGKEGEYQTARVWKGENPTLYLVPAETTEPGARYPEGKRFLALFYDDATTWLPIEDAGELLRFLENPRPLTRRELLQMLRGWHGGTIDDEAMAKWLEEVKPVAQVDDWTVDDISLTLAAIEDLHYRIHGHGELDLTCVYKVLREQVAPLYIRAIESRAMELPQTELIELEECQ